MATVHPAPRRARLLVGIALALSRLLAIGVRVGLDDGGWPLFVPAAAAAIAFARLTMVTLLLAIVVTGAMLILGLWTVGIFYGFSLAALIFALAALRHDARPMLG
jgi:hypothetical protein